MRGGASDRTQVSWRRTRCHVFQPRLGSTGTCEGEDRSEKAILSQTHSYHEMSLLAAPSAPQGDLRPESPRLGLDPRRARIFSAIHGGNESICAICADQESLVRDGVRFIVGACVGDSAQCKSITDEKPFLTTNAVLRRIALAPYTRREMCQRRQTTAALKQVETWRKMNAWSPLPCRHGRRKIFH